MLPQRRLFLQFTTLGGLLAWWRPMSAGTASRLPPTPSTTLSAWFDTLIPADETPGAVELGVLRLVEGKANNNATYKIVLRRGRHWLNREARSHGGKYFALLPTEEREQIVAKAESSKRRSLPRVFFEITRADAFHFYYADPRSWAGLGFEGPPQPRGYTDYTLPPHP